MADGEPTTSSSAGKALLWLIVGVPVAILGSCGILLAVSGNSDRDRGPSDVEVRNQCREWVDAQLVAPADADYSGEVVSGDGPWSVTGDVDAPNRVGVTLRMTYDCDIRLDGDTWRGSATVTE